MGRRRARAEVTTEEDVGQGNETEVVAKAAMGQEAGALSIIDEVEEVPVQPLFVEFFSGKRN